MGARFTHYVVPTHIMPLGYIAMEGSSRKAQPIVVGRILKKNQLTSKSFSEEEAINSIKTCNQWHIHKLHYIETYKQDDNITWPFSHNVYDCWKITHLGQLIKYLM